MGTEAVARGVSRQNRSLKTTGRCGPIWLAASSDMSSAPIYFDRRSLEIDVAIDWKAA